MGNNLDINEKLKVVLLTKRSNTYAGDRCFPGTTVTVNGHLLDPRFDLVNHSPTLFEWGYNGSGPAQLAIAILAFEYMSSDIARAYYQRFKENVISRFGKPNWTLTSVQIDSHMYRLLKEDQKYMYRLLKEDQKSE